ncbi:hypothetical protein C2S52_016180 [Perilla frutescens var. hirtella]|nr:hypothetical protein C2S52_016180 [Perilla frutescens var. hirtella]
MTGRSMFWAQWVLRRSTTIPWDQFSQEIIERFGDTSSLNAYEAMHLTRQTESLEDYISLFEERVAQLSLLPPEHYLSAFLGGLQYAIREKIPDAEMADVFTAIKAALHIAHSTKSPLMQQRSSISTASFTRPTTTFRSGPSPTALDSG